MHEASKRIERMTFGAKDICSYAWRMPCMRINYRNHKSLYDIYFFIDFIDDYRYDISKEWNPSVNSPLAPQP